MARTATCRQILAEEEMVKAEEMMEVVEKGRAAANWCQLCFRSRCSRSPSRTMRTGRPARRRRRCRPKPIGSERRKHQHTDLQAAAMGVEATAIEVITVAGCLQVVLHFL